MMMRKTWVQRRRLRAPTMQHSPKRASHQLTLQGSVDADNAGISTSVQQIETGVTVTSTVVYRTTETPGVFGAGLSIVARDRDATCTLSYAGTAKLKG